MDGITDHDLVLCECAYPSSSRQRLESGTLRDVRKPSVRAIDVNKCGPELEAKLATLPLPVDLNGHAEKLTSCLLDVMNTHAPVHRVRIMGVKKPRPTAMGDTCFEEPPSASCCSAS